MGRCSDARERLVTTAAKLFHERGYTAVSVSDICLAAGLKKGSFYHFFESKHALLLETIEGFAQHSRAGMRELGRAHGSVRGRIIGMFESMAGTFETRIAEGDGRMLGCPIGNLALEMADRDPEIRAKLEATFREWKQEFARMLARAHTDGELEVADPDATAESLVALLEGAVMLAKTMADPSVLRRAAQTARVMLSPQPGNQPAAT